VSVALFYVWKKKYAHRGTGELRHIWQLEEENARLKRVAADLTPDNHIVLETIRRN
jgi:putative transposase